jgi:hypothetical protein
MDVDIEDLIPPKLATNLTQHVYPFVHVESEIEEENECFPTVTTPMPHFISGMIMDITMCKVLQVVSMVACHDFGSG